MLLQRERDLDSDGKVICCYLGRIRKRRRRERRGEGGDAALLGIAFSFSMLTALLFV